MGTHALTNIEADGVTLLTIFRHYDGYPAGHGADLADILREHADDGFGIPSIAAWVVAGLKPRAGNGNIYIEPADGPTKSAEYVYTVSRKGRALWLRCVDTWGNKVLYDGPAAEYPHTTKAAA